MMRKRIAAGVVVLGLAAVPAAAQGRGPQIVTGVSLASFGVYAALADRDCDVHPQTTLHDGRCVWRNSRGRLVGEMPELPAEQLAGGLVAAGIGGLMASGAWRPSRTVDTLVTAGAGVLLLAVARDDTYPRGTVHEDTVDGRRLTSCPYPGGSVGFDGSIPGVDLCAHASFSRIHAMWTGIATLGLAAGRWLWRGQPRPPVSLDVRPGGIRVSRTIEF